MLRPRSAVERRRRKTRPETGEKMSMRAEKGSNIPEQSDWQFFVHSVGSSESPSPSPRREKKKSKKKKKKRYSYIILSSNFSTHYFFLFWYWLFTANFSVSVMHQKTRKKTGGCFWISVLSHTQLAEHCCLVLVWAGSYLQSVVGKNLRCFLLVWDLQLQLFYWISIQDNKPWFCCTVTKQMVRIISRGL